MVAALEQDFTLADHHDRCQAELGCLRVQAVEALLEGAEFVGDDGVTVVR